MTEDYQCILCPLTSIEPERPDDDGEYLFLPKTCGEEVHVTHQGFEYLWSTGPEEDFRTDWKVECLAGHVLVVPNDNGNDCDIPLEWSVVRQILVEMGCGFRDV